MISSIGRFTKYTRLSINIPRSYIAQSISTFRNSNSFTGKRAKDKSKGSNEIISLGTDLTQLKKMLEISLLTLINNTVTSFKFQTQPIQIGRTDPKNIIITNGKDTYPIKKIGQVIVKSPLQMTICVFDPKQTSLISQTIDKLNIGLNTSEVGNEIIVNILKPTKEVRLQKIKLVNQILEESKGRVRRIRKKILDDISKVDSTVSDDEIFKLKKTSQEIVDEYTKKIEDLYKAKSEDLMK